MGNVIRALRGGDSAGGIPPRAGGTPTRLRGRLALLAVDDAGMSTVEYAIGTIAAAAFGAILYTVVTGDSIVSALTNIISRALNTNV
jgi:hypothetical protein